MNKILVTGADGLLGSNLVRTLLARNYEVRVLIQRGRKVPSLDGLPLERMAGDVLDIKSLEDAVKGCNKVIHVAANTSVWPSRGEIYYKVNVEGTLNMIQVTQKSGIERFVHVGSASSFGIGSKAKPGTETDPCVSAKYGMDYIDTKVKGQLVVLDAVKKEGFPALVVNPTFMIGPYDSKPSSGAVVIAAAKGQVPGFTGGGRNWVHVRDVAEAIANALTMGKIGEAYILGHENLSYKEAITQICEVVGTKPPRLTVPDFIIKTIGLAGSAWGQISGNPPKLTYPMAKVSCDEHYFSPAKAIRELNLPQTGLKTATQEAYAWFQENGYL
ncbi:MAG: NAD-dependent epimerase/dehydratase family protein [Bacteroidia bacterium]|nr:NAD-dependent epimerase/dehydratase family protein [Bacteroidia bacterium]